MKKCCLTCEHLRNVRHEIEGGHVLYLTDCDGFGGTLTELDALNFWCFAYEENEELRGGVQR